MKKMIVIDLDGTLLHLDSSCPTEVQNYLHKLKEQGYIIVLASGRNLQAVKEVTNMAFFANYIIANTGGYIYDIDNKRIIFEKIIDKETVRKICSYYDNDVIDRIEIVSSQYYTRYTFNDLPTDKLNKNVHEMNDIDKLPLETIHLSIKLKDFNDVDELALKLQKEFDQLDFNIMQDSFSPVKWIEISNKNISKYSAILKLANLLYIENSNIIAFGDGLNDIDMLTNCGISVAMGNALDEVKKKAKYITETNENDGVMTFLKNYLKK